MTTKVYELPICNACHKPLMIVQHHIHEYLKFVSVSGKVGKNDKTSFRHVANEMLRCKACDLRFIAKRDEEGRFIRGRRLPRKS
jgi:hypothetical protein